MQHDHRGVRPAVEARRAAPPAARFGDRDARGELRDRHRAFVLGASTLPFLWNVFRSYRYGELVTVDDPWGFGNSLEWATSCPPPRHNFTELPRIRSERPAFELRYPRMADRMRAEAHDGEGWSAREIGQTCGLKTEATHKRLQRGRLRLARELAAGKSAATPASPSCRWARTSASDYLDGRLDDASRCDIEEHLRHCERCPPLVQALIGLRAALHEGSYDTSIPAAVSRDLSRIAGADGPLS